MNTLLTHDGRTLSLSAWARETGLARATIETRLMSGWSVGRALTERPKPRARRGGRHPAGIPRPVPRLRRHAGGQAFARWRQNGRDASAYFGAWGSAAATDAYRVFAARWVASGVPAAGPVLAGGVSVAAMLLAWVQWCEEEYVKFGRPTSEVQHCRRAAALLNASHGSRPAGEFRPGDLADVQRAWVARGLARATIKIYRSRVVRAFRWAGGAGLIPPNVAAALRDVPDLKPGRTTAAEPVGRTVVAWDVVERTLPHLPGRPARRAALEAAIRFQWHTGCRPCEVCAIRPEDVTEVDGVQVYTVPPHANKNHHRGKVQWYAIGPRAWAALAPHLDGAAKGKAVFPAKCTYQGAIRRACVAGKVPRWTAHQLRHAYATAAATASGSIAGAAAAIGDTAAVARGYVHCDPQAAQKIELAKRLG